MPAVHKDGLVSPRTLVRSFSSNPDAITYEFPRVAFAATSRLIGQVGLFGYHGRAALAPIISLYFLIFSCSIGENTSSGSHCLNYPQS